MRLRYLAAAAIAMAFIAGAPTAATADGGAIFVDDDHANCPNAEAQTIQEGVGLAPPGGTVVVCAGDYSETVTVDKPLTLNGAGPDPHVRTGDTTQEAVLARPGDMGFILAAPDITLEGFTIRNTPVGVRTLAQSAGFAIRKNLLLSNASALELASTGGEASIVRENTFRTNRRFGIFNGGGPLLDTSIVVNEFDRDDSAISALGQVQRVVVDGNTFVGQRTSGVQISGADNAVTHNNFVLVARPIRVSGFTPNRVAYNELDRGRVAGITFSGGSRAAVEYNRVIQQQGDSIQLQASIRSDVRGNHIEASARDGIALINGARDNLLDVNDSLANGRDGIFLDGSTFRNQIQNSRADDNVEFDCRDDTVGPFPGGTRNIWEHDLGDTANRPEICKPTGQTTEATSAFSRLEVEPVADDPCLPYSEAQEIAADSPAWGEATWVCDPTPEELGPPPED